MIETKQVHLSGWQNGDKYMRKLESEYESAKSQIKSYSSMEFTTVLLLLLIFIIPGVIYIAYKTNQKNSINENNEISEVECKQLSLTLERISNGGGL